MITKEDLKQIEQLDSAYLVLVLAVTTIPPSTKIKT